MGTPWCAFFGGGGGRHRVFFRPRLLESDRGAHNCVFFSFSGQLRPPRNTATHNHGHGAHPGASVRGAWRVGSAQGRCTENARRSVNAPACPCRVCARLPSVLPPAHPACTERVPVSVTEGETATLAHDSPSPHPAPHHRKSCAKSSATKRPASQCRSRGPACSG